MDDNFYPRENVSITHDATKYHNHKKDGENAKLRSPSFL